MIRINLLGEKEDLSGVFALHVLSFAGVMTAVCAVCLFIYIETSSALTSMREEKDQLQSRLTGLQAQTKKVLELEAKRKVLREKLMTITTLKSRKHGPVHTMDDLNTAIPERAWLLSTSDKGSGFEITGIALDDPTVATFMYNLEQSNYFTSIELIQSAEERINEVKMKKFTILTKLKDPLALKTAAPAGSAGPAAQPKVGKDATKTAAGA